MLDGTRKFSLVDESNKEMKRTLTTVYDALKEKGYNPINQIVGYLLFRGPDLHNKSQQHPQPDLHRSRRTHAGLGLFPIWITEFAE